MSSPLPLGKFTELLNVDIYPQALRSRYYNKFAAWEKVIIITTCPYSPVRHRTAASSPLTRKFEKDGTF